MRSESEEQELSLSPRRPVSSSLGGETKDADTQRINVKSATMNFMRFNSCSWPSSPPTSLFSTESRNYLEKISHYVKTFFYYILLLSILCSLFIAEIVVAAVFQSDIICDSPMSVTPLDWLVVDATTGVVWILLLLVTSHRDLLDRSGQNDDLVFFFYVAYNLSIFVSVFRFAWLVVGSILLWNSQIGCGQIEPKSVDTIMWVVLVSSYIAIFLRLLQHPQDENRGQVLHPVSSSYGLPFDDKTARHYVGEPLPSHVLTFNWLFN